MELRYNSPFLERRRRWVNVMWKKFISTLERPVLGTRIIPPGARVNPALFAEDEFPVYCLKCDYLLRGLPDGRCPECGEGFERGRLLVEQYVTRASDRHLRRSLPGRLAWWLPLAGMLLVGVSACGNLLAARYYLAQAQSGSNPRAAGSFLEWMALSAKLVYAVQIVVLAGLLGWAVISLRSYRKERLKRQRVVDAL